MEARGKGDEKRHKGNLVRIDLLHYLSLFLFPSIYAWVLPSLLKCSWGNIYVWSLNEMALSSIKSRTTLSPYCGQHLMIRWRIEIIRYSLQKLSKKWTKDLGSHFTKEGTFASHWISAVGRDSEGHIVDQCRSSLHEHHGMFLCKLGWWTPVTPHDLWRHQETP
jgi:hypothetical protein